MLFLIQLLTKKMKDNGLYGITVSILLINILNFNKLHQR
jgi:hypothetical protein